MTAILETLGYGEVLPHIEAMPESDEAAIQIFQGGLRQESVEPVTFDTKPARSGGKRQRKARFGHVTG